MEYNSDINDFPGKKNLKMQRILARKICSSKKVHYLYICNTTSSTIKNTSVIIYDTNNSHGHNPNYIKYGSGQLKSWSRAHTAYVLENRANNKRFIINEEMNNNI